MVKEKQIKSLSLSLSEFDRFHLDEYEWKYDHCPLPSNEELRIYEIHVGDFTGGDGEPENRGQFKHVIEKIDYFKQLGINASKMNRFSVFLPILLFVSKVEMMPIKEYAGKRKLDPLISARSKFFLFRLQ